MFLQYTTVAVFGFTMMFNLLNLYSLVETFENYMFPTCEMCKESSCHIVDKRPCITTYREGLNFSCYTCDKNDDGVIQHYTEDLCKETCTEPGKACICDFECYICIPKLGDMKNWTGCNHYRVQEPTCV